MRIIFHIDVNSAYLSWTAVEQLKNGAGVDIRTIPAIIGGDQKSRHGIVLAKSISAKKYGIRTGEPVANAFRKCPNLKTYLPDHQMYREYSRKLMEFLRTYTTHIEQVSVDECYMDFTEIADRFTSPVEGASEIKDEVYKRFGFTVNVGISSRKVLAKMASDFEKPNKVHTLFPEEIPAKMWPLPIGELFMAGRSSVETMKKLEIYTIGDLANTDPAILELHLKSHGRKLWEFANGLDDSEVESVRAEAKGVGNSTTLPKDLITEAEALPVLKDLAVSVGQRLRKARQKAGMVNVEIKYHTFNQVSHQKQMERQTNQDQDIYQASIELFRELWSGEPIRLLGIRTSKLSEESEPEQLSLFDMKFESEETRKKKKNLKEALKKLEGKYGDGIVKKGW
nr:DNA polymerase IV [uncultured Dorea sp.]